MAYGLAGVVATGGGCAQGCHLYVQAEHVGPVWFGLQDGRKLCGAQHLHELCLAQPGRL